MLKDFSGRITNNEPGLALLQSDDGIKWTSPKNPFFMPKQVKLVNGETIKVNRLERPQLLIGDDGFPLVIYFACALVDVNQRNDGTSFNIQIPLKTHSK